MHENGTRVSPRLCEAHLQTEEAPAGRWCSRWTCENWLARSLSSFSCAFCLPIMAGICLRRCPMIRQWILAARTLFTNSFTCTSIIALLFRSAYPKACIILCALTSMHLLSSVIAFLAGMPKPTHGQGCHLSVACALGDIIQVLQQVGLLLLKELHTRRIQVRPHWLVCIEGPYVHLAHLQACAGLSYPPIVRQDAHLDECTMHKASCAVCLYDHMQRHASLVTRHFGMNLLQHKIHKIMEH